MTHTTIWRDITTAEESVQRMIMFYGSLYQNLLIRPSSPLDVPFKDEPYPGRPFFDYLESFVKMNIYETSEPRVAHFLQTWLFFGLLTEVLQSKITTDDFL